MNDRPTAPRPLRILHCACFHHRKYSAWYPSIDQKLTNGFIRNGHSVETFSYRDVAKNEAWFPSKKLGAGRANLRLAGACANYEPDLLLLGHSEIIRSETITAIRRRHPRLKVAMWYCDPLWVPEKMALVKRWASVCDVVFTTSGGPWLEEISREGAVAAHFPNPVDASIETHRAFAATDWDQDLFFAGTEKGEPGRTALLEQLRGDAGGLRFRIHKAFGQPPITGHAYFAALSRSLMGLNLSRRSDVPWYASDRIAHFMGNGVLALTPRTPGLTELFSEDAMGWFGSYDELRALIYDLVKRPEEARRRAEKGWVEAHAKCDTRRVTAWMLDLIEGLAPTDNVPWASQVFRS
jgi:hypothetical protein